MRKIPLVSFVFAAVAVLALVVPGLVSAEGTISTIVVDEGAFITVKESVAGDILSLYRIRGDRIFLVDTVVNTGSRSDRDLKLSNRFLHRVEVENR